MGSRFEIGLATLLVAVLAAVLIPCGAGAADVINGGFESGTLNGWHVQQATQAGNWFAYTGTDAPIGSKRPTPADPIQPPPQGSFAAIADQANPDSLILYQDVLLEPGLPHFLSLLAFYDTYDPLAVPTPDTLSVDDEVLGGQANQQYRIDVIRPEAPLDSLDPADILRTVFRARRGNPARMLPTRLTADLSQFGGQTVRLRIAAAVHEEVLNAGVDAVSITATPPGHSGEGLRRRDNPKRFRVGRAKANRNTGIVTLRVEVLGSGLLRAKGVSTRPPRLRAAGSLRKSIEPVTVPVALAKTVSVRLRPTASARAILRRRGKIQVDVGLTYMPTNGTPEVASVPVEFKLSPRPPRRR
jgi:hypothetical protein